MTEIEILETTYFDRCIIKRIAPVKNQDTGVTETTEVVIVSDCKCALSKANDQVITIDGVGSLNFNHSLHINPSVDLRSGDTVIIDGKEFMSNEPFIYPNSHQKSMLTFRGRV